MHRADAHQRGYQADMMKQRIDDTDRRSVLGKITATKDISRRNWH